MHGVGASAPLQHENRRNVKATRTVTELTLLLHTCAPNYEPTQHLIHPDRPTAPRGRRLPKRPGSNAQHRRSGATGHQFRRGLLQLSDVRPGARGAVDGPLQSRPARRRRRAVYVQQSRSGARRNVVGARPHRRRLQLFVYRQMAPQRQSKDELYPARPASLRLRRVVGCGQRVVAAHAALLLFGRRRKNRNWRKVGSRHANRSGRRVLARAKQRGSTVCARGFVATAARPARFSARSAIALSASPRATRRTSR